MDWWLSLNMDIDSIPCQWIYDYPSIWAIYTSFDNGTHAGTWRLACERLNRMHTVCKCMQHILDLSAKKMQKWLAMKCHTWCTSRSDSLFESDNSRHSDTAALALAWTCGKSKSQPGKWNQCWTHEGKWRISNGMTLWSFHAFSRYSMISMVFQTHLQGGPSPFCPFSGRASGL